MGLLDAIQDPEFWGMMAKQAPSNLLQAAKGNAAGLLGGPVDLATMVMRPFGYNVEAPVMGSEWIRQQTQQPRTTAYSIGEMLPMGMDDVARVAAPVATAAVGLLAMHKMAGSADNLPALARAMPGQQGALVYHGSPHKFDKFDMSKIGTGEGAQAYGHGLYFAESPAVATDYATKLSSAGLAKNKLAQSGGDIDAAITAANERIANYKNLIANGGGGDPRRAQGMLNLAEKTLNDLLAMKSGTLNEAGNLYKVDIPDESIPKMLDWDKPLSEQAPEVQVLLKQAGYEIRPQKIKSNFAFGDEKIASPTGREFYNSFGANVALSKELKKAGIPGIRYKDAMSRGTDAGTSNYVLFDDTLARILERNGMPTGMQPWQPGEWQGLLK